MCSTMRGKQRWAIFMAILLHYKYLNLMIIIITTVTTNTTTAILRRTSTIRTITNYTNTVIRNAIENPIQAAIHEQEPTASSIGGGGEVKRFRDQLELEPLLTDYDRSRSLIEITRRRTIPFRDTQVGCDLLFQVMVVVVVVRA